MRPTTVHELRLVVTVPDFDAAVHLYRDVLGLTEVLSDDSASGRVVILQAGRATLELADPEHAAYVDEVEVGRRVAGQVRVAFGVDDVDAATRQVADAGAPILAQPTLTPWGSRNARIEGAGDLQLTLFEGDV